MDNLKTLNDFIELVDFLDEEMTPSLASKVADQAKVKLSKPDILRLGDACLTMSAEAASLFTIISEYDAEMGGLAQY